MGQAEYLYNLVKLNFKIKNWNNNNNNTISDKCYHTGVNKYNKNDSAINYNNDNKNSNILIFFLHIIFRKKTWQD